MTKKHKTTQKKATAEPDALAGIFPIVGIGASAGGLAAFEAFFSTGMMAGSNMVT
jgi:chemotaxis response regulator CheB